MELYSNPVAITQNIRLQINRKKQVNEWIIHMLRNSSIRKGGNLKKYKLYFCERCILAKQVDLKSFYFKKNLD